MSRILIADPQPFIRAALRQRLVAAGHEVLGETGDGRDALGLVQKLHPDLLILDLDLPRLGGLEMLRRFRSISPRQKTLVFTHLSGAYYQGLCLNAGASGFVHKSDLPEELDEAVKLVLSGRKVFPARLPADLGDHESAGGTAESITPRELTVLQYLAQGYRVKDIAEQLAISDRTVSTYKTRLLEKTQTDSLIDLVQAARQRGLLDDGVIRDLVRVPGPQPQTPGRLAQLLEILPNPVSLWSLEGTLLACNPRFAEFYAKSEAEMLGASIFSMGLVDSQHIQQARREFFKGAASSEPFTLIVNAHNDAEQRIVRLIGVPMKEESGNPIGILISSVDITEHERYVEQLQESKAYLESRYSSRTGFLLTSGRDLLAELDSLEALLVASRARHPEDAALNQSSAHMGKMRDKIEVLLELTRLEQGNVLTIPQSENLNELTLQALHAVDPPLPLHPCADAPWGWIDANRYLRLNQVLLRSFDKAGLPPLEVTADCQPLPHGELHWQLTFRAVQAEDVQSNLVDIEQQARIQLAHWLCRLLGGELTLGSAVDAAVAARIRLKLAKGSPRF
ncbi:response regulator [Pseudomonas pseudonitroreducens]|uniref:response regulator n=1 Tax=Pseudomonas pseudonitroreducens TaxID=2892326 RepID=UPI001F3B84DE|nr:response regulator [Pseudomonas pseudonitroreducens]